MHTINAEDVQHSERMLHRNNHIFFFDFFYRIHPRAQVNCIHLNQYRHIHHNASNRYSKWNPRHTNNNKQSNNIIICVTEKIIWGIKDILTWIILQIMCFACFGLLVVRQWAWSAFQILIGWLYSILYIWHINITFNNNNPFTNKWVPGLGTFLYWMNFRTHYYIFRTKTKMI